MLVSQMPFTTSAQPQSSSGIRAIVIVKDMYDSGDDIWPDRFTVRPERGDVVQSSGGRRLSVLDVVHIMTDGQPILQVEIGVDRNDNTATGDAGGGESVYV